MQVVWAVIRLSAFITTLAPSGGGVTQWNITYVGLQWVAGPGINLFSELNHKPIIFYWVLIIWFITPLHLNELCQNTNRTVDVSFFLSFVFLFCVLPSLSRFIYVSLLIFLCSFLPLFLYFFPSLSLTFFLSTLSFLYVFCCRINSADNNLHTKEQIIVVSVIILMVPFHM